MDDHWEYAIAEFRAAAAGFRGRGLEETAAYLEALADDMARAVDQEMQGKSAAAE